MVRFTPTKTILILAFALALGVPARAADWTVWRGRSFRQMCFPPQRAEK